MKYKVLCFIFILFFVFIGIYAEENDNEVIEETVIEESEHLEGEKFNIFLNMNEGLGISGGYPYMATGEDGKYKSEVTGLPFYINPNFHFDVSFLFGKYFSIDPFIDYNLVSFVKGFNMFIDTSSKWTETMKLGTYFPFQYTIYGTGECLIFLAATIYSIMGVDYGIRFYAHPFTNDFMDIKIGAGIMNQPSLFFDKNSYSIFFYPTADFRFESCFFNSWGVISVFAGYNFDFLNYKNEPGNSYDLSNPYGGVCFSYRIMADKGLLR